MLWWEDFGKHKDAAGGPPFYGPHDYSEGVRVVECDQCASHGKHEHGRCVRCDGTGHYSRPDMPDYDKCQTCKGAKGGVPGNENIIDGLIMCDYCDAALPTPEPGDGKEE